MDGNHWYLPDGTPFYEIRAKDGHMRPTTLRDARKFGAVPSVTTVLRIIAMPQLEAWKVRQGILSALTITRVAGEDDATYLARIDHDAKAQAEEAAAEGTRVHDALEQAARGREVPAQYAVTVAAVREAIGRAFPGITDWVPEKHIVPSGRAGYGGRVDLYSPSTGIVIDYKGKDGDFSDGKKLAYDQNYQLAAYQHALGYSVGPCANVFFSRTHPGAIKVHTWTESEIRQGLGVFLAAFDLWCCVNGYVPNQLMHELSRAGTAPV